MFMVIILIHTISTGSTHTIKVDPKYPSYETCEAGRPAAETAYKRYLEIRRAPEFTLESQCRADEAVKDGV